jgi:hypothetical protein
MDKQTLLPYILIALGSLTYILPFLKKSRPIIPAQSWLPSEVPSANKALRMSAF